MRKPLRTRSIASPLDEESGDSHVYRLGASQAVVHRAMSVGPSKQLSQVVTLIVIRTLFVSFCVNCLLKPSCEIPSWVKLGSETLSPSTRDKLRSTCGFRQWKTNQTDISLRRWRKLMRGSANSASCQYHRQQQACECST